MPSIYNERHFYLRHSCPLKNLVPVRRLEHPTLRLRMRRRKEKCPVDIFMTTGEGHLISRNGSDGEFSDRVPEAESEA